MTLPAYSPDMYPGKPHAFEQAGEGYPQALCKCFKHRDHASHVEPDPKWRFEHTEPFERRPWAYEHEALPHFNERGSCGVCLFAIRRVSR